MNKTTQQPEVKPTRPAAPEGFVYNAEGNLIAQCNIPAHELRKDAFVTSLVETSVFAQCSGNRSFTGKVTYKKTAFGRFFFSYDFILNLEFSF